MKADGVVRLFRNYDPDLATEPLQMVSAFRGLSELIQMRRGTGSGIVMDWKQPDGTLLIGGDSKVIRVWDAPTETTVLVSPNHDGGGLILTESNEGSGYKHI